MRKLIAILVFTLIANFSFAQEVQPKFEIEKDLVKATYFHDNGVIKMEGYFNDEKLHGKWISYNVNGKITTIAHYKNGEKVGTWLFSNKNDFKQVIFKDNQVAEVTELKDLDLAIN